jgi:hypothetical protein
MINTLLATTGITGLGITGLIVYYGGLKKLPFPASALNNRVTRAVSSFFSNTAHAIRQRLNYFEYFKTREEIQSMLAQYSNLPQQDSPFMERVLELHANTLTAEGADLLVQNNRENDVAFINTIILLSWRALLFSQVDESRCPNYLKTFRSGGEAWAELSVLRKKFRWLSPRDQKIILEHHDPASISLMTVSKTAEDIYKGIGAIANRYIQGNTAFNNCLEVVFLAAKKREQQLSADALTPSSTSSRVSNRFIFWVSGGGKKLEDKQVLFSNLPTGSIGAPIRELLQRYRNKLSRQQLQAFNGEVKTNLLYGRRAVLWLYMRAYFLSSNQLPCQAIFSPVERLSNIKATFTSLPSIDKYYILATLFPIKDPDHPVELSRVLEGVTSLVNEALEKESVLREYIDPTLRMGASCELKSP